MTEQRRLRSYREERQVFNITCGGNLIKKETNFWLDFNNSAAFGLWCFWCVGSFLWKGLRVLMNERGFIMLRDILYLIIAWDLFGRRNDDGERVFSAAKSLWWRFKLFPLYFVLPYLSFVPFFDLIDKSKK